MSPGFTTVAPDGVSDADWQHFLTRVAFAVPRLDALPAGLPDPFCDPRGDKKAVSISWPTLGDVNQALGSDYLTEIQAGNCGQRKANGGWRPGGVFNQLPAGKPRSPTGSALTGLALGVYAQRIDDDVDDLHVGYRPAGLLSSPLGQFVDKAAKLWVGIEVAFVPGFCLIDLFFGRNCLDDAKSVADTLDPAQLDGFVPLIGDKTTLDDTSVATVFHFINVQGARSEMYDSPQGMLYDEAGLHGLPDAVDVGIMLLTDALGYPSITTRYDSSNGPKNYEVQPPYDDGVRPTKHRTKAQWQATNFGHTAFEPLDNLAYYGWSNFVNDPNHSAEWLAWPLHGIGDAVAPHHLIGSTGWGHRPFENAVEHRWAEIRFQTDNPGGDNSTIEANAPDFATGFPSQTGRDVQDNQLRRILAHALRYNQLIEQWRSSSVASDSRDIPIRQLIVQVATDAFSFLNSDESGATPYSYRLSLEYLFNEAYSENPYHEDKDSTKNSNLVTMRGLIERGAGATVALLVAAADFSPPVVVAAPDNVCSQGFRSCNTCHDCPADQGCVVVGGASTCTGCLSDADCCDQACDTTNHTCTAKPPPFVGCQSCADCVDGQACLAGGSCGPCLSDKDCCRLGDVCDTTMSKCVANIK
jgi:hypothetical protein